MNRRTLLSVCAPMFLTMVVVGQQATRSVAAPDPQITTPRATPGRGLTLDGPLLRVNPAAVRSYLAGSASLTHGTLPPGGCASRAVPVTGAVVGDRVAVGAPAELLTLPLSMTYAVTDQDTVSIRLCNISSSAVTPPSWTWNVDVIKSF